MPNSLEALYVKWFCMKAVTARMIFLRCLSSCFPCVTRLLDKLQRFPVPIGTSLIPDLGIHGAPYAFLCYHSVLLILPKEGLLLQPLWFSHLLLLQIILALSSPYHGPPSPWYPIPSPVHTSFSLYWMLRAFIFWSETFYVIANFIIFSLFIKSSIYV